MRILILQKLFICLFRRQQEVNARLVRARVSATRRGRGGRSHRGRHPAGREGPGDCPTLAQGRHFPEKVLARSILLVHDTEGGEDEAKFEV